MADVFISYKRDDRPAIEQMALRLRELGLTIWFDAGMSAGETFSDEIDREARGAKLILVCWSPAARESRWVKAEAMIGFEQDKLAACYVAGPDGFSPPTPFNTIHAEDLRAWLTAPSDTHAGWKSVLRRIGRLCGRADVESWGALDAQPTANELRSWISAHADSPLFMNVDELLRTREAQDVERGRLEQAARERRAQEEAERRARDAAEETRQESERRQREAKRASAPTPPPDTASSAPSNVVGTILALALAAFGGFALRYSASVFAMPIQQEWGLADAEVGLSLLVSSISMMVLALVAGALADQRSANRVHIVSAGLALAALSSIAMGFAQNFFQLLLLRLILGAGAGLIVAPALTLIGNLTSFRHRALSLALIAASSSLAGLALSSAGAFMVTNFGWRLIHMVIGGAGLALTLTVILTARDRPQFEPPMGRQAAASTTLLLVAVAVHTAFMSGLSMWLPFELRSQFGGIYPFELASYLWFPLAGGVLGALVGGALGDSASGNPKRYASVFLGSALLSGISLIAFVLGSTTLLSAVALATAASTFAAGWYGVAFATVQRLSAGQQGLVTGAMLAVASLAASLAPVALGWLRDNTEQPFLYWSGLAGFTGLLLIALHATLRDKVA